VGIGLKPAPVGQVRGAYPSLVQPRGTISAIDVLFSDHPKCLGLMFIYVSGLMISIGNLRFLKHTSIAGGCTFQFE
jgi:hypothetical protein